MAHPKILSVPQLAETRKRTKSTHLTESIISLIRLEPGQKPYDIQDADTPGLLLRVKQTGLYWGFRYSSPSCPQTRTSIGKHGKEPFITLAKARREAAHLRSAIMAGRAPNKEREAQVEVAIAKSQAPTLDELFARFLTEHAANRKRPTSIRQDKSNYAKYLQPTLGKLHVHAITTAHLQAIHTTLAPTKVTANRVRSLASTLFNLAEHWDLRPQGTNPTKRIKPYHEEGRKEYLTPDQLSQLLSFLKDTSNTPALFHRPVRPAGKPLAYVTKRTKDRKRPRAPETLLRQDIEATRRACAFLMLLICTGCRHQELATLEWDRVDLDQRQIRVLSKNVALRTVLLNQPAIDSILAVPRATTGRVFGASKSTLLSKQAYAVWSLARAHIGRPHLHIHDLRHTWASLAVSAGHNLTAIGANLGHTSHKTTARYAHLFTEAARKTSDDVGRIIANHATKEKPPEPGEGSGG